MIFNNTLNSNSNNCNYDCSYGASLALVESARNDFNMFKAMIECDYNEINIKNKYSGYMMESEINALHESTGKSIFKRIAEFFRALAEKIRRIFTSFFTRTRNIVKKDEKTIDEIIDSIPDNGKGGIIVRFKSETAGYTLSRVKFIHALSNFDADTLESKYSKEYDEDDAKRYNNLVHRLLLGKFAATNNDELYNELIGRLLELSHKIDGDFKRELKSRYNQYSENINRSKKEFDEIESNIKRIAKEFEQKANSTNKDEIEEINKQYLIAKDIENITITFIKATLYILNTQYRSYKAALIELATNNESAIYTEALIDADYEEFDIMMI